jgi:hypothetical protein
LYFTTAFQKIFLKGDEMSNETKVTVDNSELEECISLVNITMLALKRSDVIDNGYLIDLFNIVDTKLNNFNNQLDEKHLL